MNTGELARALRTLTPRFQVVAGCYLLARSDTDPGHGRPEVQQAIAACDGDLKRAEDTLNRRFIVSDILDELVEERRGWGEADLLVVADVCAALLRDGLGRAFPGQPFEVAIVGGALVDDEPLELYVTFSRRALTLPADTTVG